MDHPNTMKQIFQQLNRHPAVRLFLPVFLGFVILTASTNLPDFNEAVEEFEGITAEISNKDTVSVSKESVQNPPSESVPELSSGRTFGWGQTSEVLP